MTPQPLCGRAQELAALERAWAAVAAGAGPRVAVVIGEAGLGKTRLIRAFFERLSAAAPVPRYWPPTLSATGADLALWADPAACDPAAAPPFLWWGMRLEDPYQPNRVSAGVLAASVEAHLAPHLESALARRRQGARKTQMIGVARDLAIDLAADFLTLGLAKTIGSAAVELRRLHAEGREDAAPPTPGAVAATRRRTMVERTLDDIASVVAPEDAAAIPAVIVIDDAQFSTDDPGAAAFARALLDRLDADRWPVLVIFAHWQTEWRQADPGPDGGLAGRLKRLAAQSTIPVEALHLAPVADLGPMLDAALPGLAPDQRASVLQRVGGNPRFLHELVGMALMTRNRMWFADRNPAGPLTARGLEALLSGTGRLHDVVARRLEGSPEPVQQAVALASLQGVEVLTTLIPDVAARLGLDPDAVAAAAPQADRPLGFLAGGPDALAAFAQRVHYEVARDWQGGFFDPEDGRAALAEAVRAALASNAQTRMSLGAGLAVAGLAAGLFIDAQDPRDRILAGWGLGEMLRVALSRRDHYGAYGLAQRLDALIAASPETLTDAHEAWSGAIADAAEEMGDADLEARALDRMVLLARAVNEVEPSPAAAGRLARNLAFLAKFRFRRRDREGRDAALGQAYAALQPLVGAAPYAAMERDVLLAFAEVEWTLALVLTDDGAFDAADQALVRLGKVGAALADRPEDVALGMAWRGHAAVRRAQLALQTGDPAAAEDRLAPTIAQIEALADPARFAPILAEGRATLAEARLRLGRSGAAAAEAALAAARSLFASDPTPSNRAILGWALLREAESAERRGDDALAAARADEGLALLRLDDGGDGEGPEPGAQSLLHGVRARAALRAGETDLALQAAGQAERAARRDLAAGYDHRAAMRLLFALGLLALFLDDEDPDDAAILADMRAEVDGLRAGLPDALLAQLRGPLERIYGAPPPPIAGRA